MLFKNPVFFQKKATGFFKTTAFSKPRPFKNSTLFQKTQVFKTPSFQKLHLFQKPQVFKNPVHFQIPRYKIPRFFQNFRVFKIPFQSPSFLSNPGVFIKTVFFQQNYVLFNTDKRFFLSFSVQLTFFTPFNFKNH